MSVMSKEFLLQIWSRILKHSQMLLADGLKCGISINLAILKLTFGIQTLSVFPPKSVRYTKDNQ